MTILFLFTLYCFPSFLLGLFPPAFLLSLIYDIKTTCLVQNSFDPTRHGFIKVCCGIWHQFVSSRSCKFLGGDGGWHCRLWSTSHRCLIRLRLENFGGHFIEFFIMFLKILLNSVCSNIEHIAIREHWYHEVVYLVCNNVQMGATCENGIHMNTRMQSYSEHCSGHHTASSGLLSSHSALWCPMNFFLQVFIIIK